jgi:hypothetical protein
VLTTLPRLAAAGLLAGIAHLAAAQPAPVFVEAFAYDPVDPLRMLERWSLSQGVDPAVRALRIGTVADPIGRTVGRFTLEPGDALQGASRESLLDKRYVCDEAGSRAAEFRAARETAPTDRVEVQVRHDRETGAGELVKFGEPVWYRFAFRVGEDWPRDRPVAGRSPCRTVIHQVKQDSFQAGQTCSASPFFKIEARPLGERLKVYGQIATGEACARPPAVTRTLICVTDDVPRAPWTRIHVRLLAATDASGRADMWLNGVHCGRYAGPMGDPVDGLKRHGKPIANAQPRFGIYRDWRGETQTIYFDRIMFWNTDPAGHPDWGVTAPPAAARVSQ